MTDLCRTPVLLVRQDKKNMKIPSGREGRGGAGGSGAGGASADGLLTSWTKGGGTTGRSALVQKYLRTLLPPEGQIMEGKIKTN